jgi:hypothetical protein
LSVEALAAGLEAVRVLGAARELRDTLGLAHAVRAAEEQAAAEPEGAESRLFFDQVGRMLERSFVESRK